MPSEKLSALEVDRATPAERPFKLADGGGLYLLVQASGRYWCFDYRHGGKRTTLAIGVYPRVSLKDARAKHRAAREQ